MKLESFRASLASLPRDAAYLIGVSGGRDSMALLHALLAQGFEKLVMCHLDHGLRGEESAGDARFVAETAASLGLECECETLDVAKLATKTGCSVETAARNARYEFFARIAKRRDCGTVFVAHHADDQVETFLFNLFRGAGRPGLGGMEADSERAVTIRNGEETAAVSLRLLRPMLGVWRQEIDEYVDANAIRFREDASNASLDYTRNRIRHELIPLAERIFGRKVNPAVQRAAEILRAEDEWLASLVSPDSEELAVPELRAQPLALQRRRIFAWLRQRGVPDCGFAEVELVRSLMDGERAKINLPGNWHARRREKRLFLERGKSDFSQASA